MNVDFLPTLLWLVVLAVGVAIIYFESGYLPSRQSIAKMVLGVLLVLAFLANAWTGFAHWAHCEDDPWSDKCEEDG